VFLRALRAVAFSLLFGCCRAKRVLRGEIRGGLSGLMVLDRLIACGQHKKNAISRIFFLPIP
jgi:hypothetical protein